MLCSCTKWIKYTNDHVHSVHTVHRNDVTSNRVCGAAEVNILFRSRSNQKKGKTEENENSRKTKIAENIGRGETDNMTLPVNLVKFVY